MRPEMMMEVIRAGPQTWCQPAGHWDMQESDSSHSASYWREGKGGWRGAWAQAVLCVMSASAPENHIKCVAAGNASFLLYSKTVWPSGLRRWLQAPVRKGVGSNPTAVIG